MLERMRLCQELGTETVEEKWTVSLRYGELLDETVHAQEIAQDRREQLRHSGLVQNSPRLS